MPGLGHQWHLTATKTFQLNISLAGDGHPSEQIWFQKIKWHSYPSLLIKGSLRNLENGIFQTVLFINILTKDNKKWHHQLLWTTSFSYAHCHCLLSSFPPFQKQTIKIKINCSGKNIPTTMRSKFPCYKTPCFGSKATIFNSNILSDTNNILISLNACFSKSSFKF